MCDRELEYYLLCVIMLKYLRSGLEDTTFVLAKRYADDWPFLWHQCDIIK